MFLIGQKRPHTPPLHCESTRITAIKDRNADLLLECGRFHPLRQGFWGLVDRCCRYRQIRGRRTLQVSMFAVERAERSDRVRQTFADTLHRWFSDISPIDWRRKGKRIVRRKPYRLTTRSPGKQSSPGVAVSEVRGGYRQLTSWGGSEICLWLEPAAAQNQCIEPQSCRTNLSAFIGCDTAIGTGAPL